MRPALMTGARDAVHRRTATGLTMVEILVAIAVIGLIAIFVIPDVLD